LPGVPTLVGLWPADLGKSDDDRLRAAIGAELTASSLHEFVMQTLDFARAEVCHPAREAAHASD
jgi:hypothetical protein